MYEQTQQHNPMAIGEGRSVHSRIVKLESLLSDQDKLAAKNLALIAVQDISGQVENLPLNADVRSNVHVLRDSTQKLVGVPAVVGG